MTVGSGSLLLLVVIYFSTITAQPPAPTPPPVPKMWGENDRNVYPNPQSYHQGCNRPDKSWICDANKVFNQSEIDDIESKLMELRDVAGGCPCQTNTTSCSYRGLPVIITIMKDFKSSDGTSSVEALMHSYAHHFLSSWNFYNCDDGIAIVVRAQASTGDDKAQVIREYSKNSQELITEKCRNYIASKSNSSYYIGDVIAGLKIELDTYRKILMTESNCEEGSIYRPTERNVSIPVVVGICVAIIVVGVIIGIGCYWSKHKKGVKRKCENTEEYMNHSKKDYRDCTANEGSDSLANKSEERTPNSPLLETDKQDTRSSKIESGKQDSYSPMIEFGKRDPYSPRIETGKQDPKSTWNASANQIPYSLENEPNIPLQPHR